MKGNGYSTKQRPAPLKTIVIPRRGRIFYFVISLVALAVVIAGFYPTYVTPMANGTFVAKPYIHLHGALFMLWIIIAIIQPMLIWLRNTSLHRKIGVPAAFLAAIMVVVGVTVAIAAARIGLADGGGDNVKAFLLIPLTDMMLFASFVTLAVVNYRRPENHKRLMVLATVAILPAAFARAFILIGLENPVAAVLTMDGIIFAGMIYDYYLMRRVHRVYVIGGTTMVLIHFGRFYVAGTRTWIEIADWILQ